MLSLRAISNSAKLFNYSNKICQYFDTMRDTMNWTYPAKKNIYDLKTWWEHPHESFKDKGHDPWYCAVELQLYS